MKKILSNVEISSLSLELSLLLHAGVGTGDALTLLAEEREASEKALLEELSASIDSGGDLASALRESGRFPAYV